MAYFNSIILSSLISCNAYIRITSSTTGIHLDGITGKAGLHTSFQGKTTVSKISNQTCQRVQMSQPLRIPRNTEEGVGLGMGVGMEGVR